MSEKFQDRYYDEETIAPIPTPRDILPSIKEERLKSKEERKAIKQYKDVVQQLNSHLAMKSYLTSRAKLNIEALKIAEKKISKLNKELSSLEKTEVLTKIYKREANITNSYKPIKVEEYLQNELGKMKLKNFFLPIIYPIIVIILIAILGAINIDLVEFLFWVIMIVPLGFLILFFLLQWIMGKEKINRYLKFIMFAILTILVVVCMVLTLVVTF